MAAQEPSIITESLENLQKVDKNVIQQFLEDLVPDVLNFSVQIVLAVLLYLVGKRVILFLCGFLRRSLERRSVDIEVRQFLDSVIRYSLYFVLWLMILTLFGITTASVIAVLGSAGLTLGLALQGSLANFAGGVLILLLRPFHVDDYIISGETGHEGIVKEISTFYTRIQTADNQTVLIPNGKLADGAIVNVTAQQTRRIDILVGIAYGADLKKAKQLLWQLTEAETRKIDSQPVNIFVSDLADSCVELGCRFWVKSEDYWQTRWDMLEAVKLAFDENDIEIPFPQVDVHMK
ncbi:Small-conductance mechanosensitive channel [Eubacterium plexicaudatum ASF492]|uniref:Small conductance mechanosensitive channel n=1 Tax=Eubacterium plexicaudatum ASF492 TaxID=1235802 RepID=N1ZX69_9FIRM|nr:Small-conductance mechanosensitive channel [Eubacterium plexicaudatum ASF492]